MSDFIVSARKYRPATFRSVVGQKHITSTLQNAIERGQLAHAYLFCGPRGVGKTTCARIFAKAINCLAPHGAEACNECESCRSFNEGRSLNIHELDAASNNSVEDIRTLIEQVRIIPQVGRYSVFIIDEVHMLSAAAFNAFLKTLEEPPAHAIFILATTEKHKIIPTILSRCQIYDFNRIRVEDSVEYLRYIASEEGVAADEESLNLIAQKADGGMRDALSMFDKAVSFCGTTLDYRNVAQTLNVLDYDTYFGVTEMLLRGDYAEALVTFDAVLSKGFSGQTFMAGLNRHMRDLLMAERPETLRLIEMTGTLLERYRTQAGACNVEFLFGAISILTELDGKIRQSSNQRLLVELGLMKIAGLGQKKNDDLTSSGEYSLPALSPRTAAGAAATPTAAARPAPQQSASTVQAQTVSAAGQTTPGTPQSGAGATVQAAVRPEAGQTAVRPDAGQAAAPPAAGQTAPSAVQPGAEQTGQGSVRPAYRRYPDFPYAELRCRRRVRRQRKFPLRTTLRRLRQPDKRYRAERRIPRRKEEWRIRRCRAGHQTRPRREERRDRRYWAEQRIRRHKAERPSRRCKPQAEQPQKRLRSPHRQDPQCRPHRLRHGVRSYRALRSRNCSPRRAAIPTKSFRTAKRPTKPKS